MAQKPGGSPLAYRLGCQRMNILPAFAFFFDDFGGTRLPSALKPAMLIAEK
jgi:hypothetical protein